MRRKFKATETQIISPNFAYKNSIDIAYIFDLSLGDSR